MPFPLGPTLGAGADQTRVTAWGGSVSSSARTSSRRWGEGPRELLSLAKAKWCRGRQCPGSSHLPSHPSPCQGPCRQPLCPRMCPTLSHLSIWDLLSGSASPHPHPLHAATSTYPSGIGIKTLPATQSEVSLPLCLFPSQHLTSPINICLFLVSILQLECLCLLFTHMRVSETLSTRLADSKTIC